MTRFGLMLAALVTFAACTPARMAVPTELDGAARLRVKRSGGLFEAGSLRFGEFVAEGIDRGWTHADRTTINGVSDKHARQRYSFDFRAPGAAMAVDCTTRVNERAVETGRATFSRSRFHLACAVSGGGLLVVDEVGHRGHAGRAMLPGLTLDVRSSSRIEGAIAGFEPVGYELLLDGHVIAAVQTINGGAVWIDPSAPPQVRQGIAVTATALLLLERIEA
jgi:hypothetical protein